MSIYQKLQEIRKRPGMYLGKNSLKLLKAYIDGYMDGHEELKRDCDFCFYPEFQDYIQDYYKIISAHN